MKKFAVLALAALLVVAFVLPVAAMEFEFGGYWRTRAYTQQNFDGTDDDVSEANDVTAVDTRTRLYLTAVFHENLKFVNKFEMDATWGAPAGSRAAGAPTNRGYGQVGADGANLEIKNSYADFNLGALNAKVGVQGIYLARGFLADNDAAAAVLNFKTDTVAIPFLWIKGYEGGPGFNARDLDIFGLAPVFAFGDFVINPYGLYYFSDNAEDYMGAAYDDLNKFFVGMDIDMDFDPVSVWLTGIYQGGDVDMADGSSQDFSGFLAALGFKFNLSFGDVHGQAFWASGDDDPNDDEDEAFVVPGLQSHYWAEIMGYGMFGDTSYYQVSNNAPADQISDIMAGNIGVTVKPMDKLTVAFDVWYARKDGDITIDIDTGRDDDVFQSNIEEDELGIELDLRLTYQLVPGMNIDLVGAYLFAGDATTGGAKDDADPYELGTRLSLSF